jgi:hypothetical protein
MAETSFLQPDQFPREGLFELAGAPATYDVNPGENLILYIDRIDDYFHIILNGNLISDSHSPIPEGISLNPLMKSPLQHVAAIINSKPSAVASNINKLTKYVTCYAYDVNNNEIYFSDVFEVSGWSGSINHNTLIHANIMTKFENHVREDFGYQSGEKTCPIFTSTAAARQEEAQWERAFREKSAGSNLNLRFHHLHWAPDQ